VDTKPKTVTLLYDNGDWGAEMVVCDEPRTVLAGGGDNVADALEDLASEVRLAEGKEDADEDETDEDDGAPNTTSGD